MNFLEEKDIVLKTRNTTYAVKSDGKNECWANPQTSILDQDWDIILNNNLDMELVLLHIPAGALSLKNGNKAGLVARKDKPELIDIKY